MQILPLFRPGESVVVAVSGGADSVALLRALNALADANAIVIVAAHINHGIRGKDADDDQLFVRGLCKRLGVELFEMTADVPALCKAQGMGIETCARWVRREFLESVRLQAGADVIATAHHADDQAETVLMHLLRGSGLRGAGGMRQREGHWIKPLLAVSKSEILAYLDALDQRYCTDESNFVCDTARNALRNDVMPGIEDVYPSARDALCRFASIAQDDDDYLRIEAERFLLKNAQALPFGARLHKANAHPAIVKRALRMLSNLNDFQSVDRLMALYNEKAGKLSLTGLEAERVNDHLYLINPVVASDLMPVEPFDGMRLPGLGTLLMKPSGNEIVKDDPFVQVVDMDAIQGAVIRHRKNGDVIWPLGAKGKRLLSDVLTDKKIDRPVRDWLMVLAKGNRILWAVGVCLSQEAAISKDTKKACRLTWMREDIIAWTTKE